MGRTGRHSWIRSPPGRRIGDEYAVQRWYGDDIGLEYFDLRCLFWELGLEPVDWHEWADFTVRGRFYKFGLHLQDSYLWCLGRLRARARSFKYDHELDHEQHKFVPWKRDWR